MQNDQTLPDDLERVGRWFWLALLLGGAVRIADFPVLFPILGVALLVALHRLGRGPGPDTVRPDVAVPAIAVVALEVATFATVLPFLGDDAGLLISTIAYLGVLVGIGCYVRALADFVRRAGLSDGRSIEHRGRQWWATAVAVVVIGIGVFAVVETDAISFDDSWGWFLGVAVASTIVFFHGLYRVGQAQWTVLAMVGRNRQRRSDNPGFTPTGGPI